MKVGDIVSIKDEWRIFEFYYGLGVITLVEEGSNATGTWKTYRVQWSSDFLFHSEEQLELVSESR